MCPALSDPPEGRRQDVPTEHLPEVTPLCSRGHSSFRRLNYPEITPSSESIVISRSILPVPGKTDQQPTSLITAYIHEDHFLIVQRLKKVF